MTRTLSSALLDLEVLLGVSSLATSSATSSFGSSTLLDLEVLDDLEVLLPSSVTDASSTLDRELRLAVKVDSLAVLDLEVLVVDLEDFSSSAKASLATLDLEDLEALFGLSV